MSIITESFRELNNEDLDNQNAISKKNILTEGTMKSIDIEIQEHGGKEAWLKYMEEVKKGYEGYIQYLDTVARREVGKGGNFDTEEEIDDVLDYNKKQLKEITNKINFVKEN